MPSVCKSCGCSDIDVDHARGDAVCTNCGSVVDDHLIVAEVEFQENSAGGANVIGQFVSADGGNNSLQLGQNFKQSLGKDNRQHIFNNGRQMINSLGSQLKLSRHCLDSAFMFYKLAVNRRLTQGRRTIHVVGACLYLVCRTEKTPHLLIDISDITQTDVFTLGRTFLALSRELCIDIPSTDPSLYIHRFAHQLKFEEKENEVATTALRLVSRMKRDWMSTGRRPSGLCGAALIVAARLHGFNRSVKDVVKIVRLSRSTIVQRLTDFGKTASSKLTIEEFNKIDLEEEADPPSFTKARQRAKQAQVYEEKMKLNSAELLAQLALTQERVEVVLHNRKMIEEDMFNRETVLPDQAERRKMIRARLLAKNSDKISESCSSKTETAICTESANACGEKSEINTVENMAGSEETLNNKTAAEIEDGVNSTICESDEGKTKSSVEEKKEKEFKETISLFNKTQTKYDCESEDDDSEDEDGNKLKKEEQDWELDLEGLDDDELDDCLLGEDEVEVKTKVWMEENGEFMEKLKEKEEREALEEEKNPHKKVHKKKKRRKKNGTAADTADEAIKAMLTERKLSSKINYDVLKDLTSSLDIGVSFEKVEPKAELQEKESKDGLFKTPIVYESGPVEKKLKFRSGLKRPPSFSDTSQLSKRIKAEMGITRPFTGVKREASIKEEASIFAGSERVPVREPVPERIEMKPVVVETGPVVIETDVKTCHDDEYEDEAADEEEAGTEHISASQLFGRADYEDGYEENYAMYEDVGY